MPRSPRSRAIYALLLFATTLAFVRAQRSEAGQQGPDACTEVPVFADAALANPGGTDGCGWITAAPPATAAGVLDVGGTDILDDFLATRIESLERGSALFRAAMALARSTRIPVVIGTPGQVRQRVGHRIALGERVAHGYLAEFLVRRSAPESPMIDLVVISIEVDALKSVPWWRSVRGSRHVQRWIDDTTEAILIHEIWGHLMPILEAGDYTGHCPDPVSGQRVQDACVMQREKAVRQELGLKPRSDYAIRVR